MEFTVNKEHDGISLLTYLKKHASISRKAISHLKTLDDGLCVNGVRVTVRYILKENDIISINSSDTDEDINESIVPNNLKIEIIYEDDNIIAVNKPINMPTHPSHDHYDDTLGNALAYIYKERNLPFVYRPAGRLDKNTSGVVIHSKNRPAASFYFNEVKNKYMQKHYIAILDGEIKCDTSKVNIINAPIKRDDESIITRSTSYMGDPNAQNAITLWKLIYANNGISIVDVQTLTGRTHQIRVHFASIGYPLLGDTLYGSGKYDTDIHMLHAISIKSKKCFTSTPLALFAEPSQEIKNEVYTKTGKRLCDIIEQYDFFENLSKNIKEVL